MSELKHVTEHEAREIASEWHGGQWSPLYALSSTGTVLSGAESEIRDNIRSLRESGQYSADEQVTESERLGRLLVYVQEREWYDDDEPRDDD